MKVTLFFLAVLMVLFACTLQAVPALAGSTSVDNHQGPSLATGITIRDPVTLDPQEFVVFKEDGSPGKTTKFHDEMLIGRADNFIAVASVGGYSGDRNLGNNFAGRIGLRMVVELVQPPKPGDDQERWLARQIIEARKRYSTSGDFAYSCPGHFAPFICFDHGDLILVVDLGVLMFGAHSLDFAVKQEGRYNALTGVDARSFYIVAGHTPGLITQSGCQPEPGDYRGSDNSDSGGDDGQGQSRDANVNQTQAPQAHKDAYIQPKTQTIPADSLALTGSLYAAAGAQASSLGSTVPEPLRGQPVGPPAVIPAWQQAEEAALDTQTRTMLSLAVSLGHTGLPNFGARSYPSSVGGDKVVVGYVMDGRWQNLPTIRFMSDSTTLETNPIPAGRVMWDDLKAGTQTITVLDPTDWTTPLGTFNVERGKSLWLIVAGHNGRYSPIVGN
jgi:hypothetical protein